MISLVIGGSGSGKSEYAESLCLQLNSDNKIYVATMSATDHESMKRIDRHKKMREGKGFTTVECYHGLNQLEITEHVTLLVECLSNLVANEMFMEVGAKSNTLEAVIEGIEYLRFHAEHIIFVSNNIFEDGIEYEDMMKEYLQCLGEINQYIVRVADSVIEVVHGIPIIVK